MNWKAYRNLLLLALGATAGLQPAAAQSDTLFLPVARLFELGVQQSLTLQADALEEDAARIREEEARANRLPNLSVGLRGGFAGQPVIFRQGCGSPTAPIRPIGRRTTPSTFRNRSTGAANCATRSAVPAWNARWPP